MDRGAADADTRDLILEFVRAHPLGVLATVGPDGAPQAALVGVAVSDLLELVFDSIATSRKVHNIERDARVALVVGGSMDDERTLQCEGVADIPRGAELSRVQEIYFGSYPDGRSRLSWPGLTHVRVRPRWLRFSDFNVRPAHIVECDVDDRGRLSARR